MKDWKAIAEASGFDVPARDMDRIAAPLNALEETFRPLIKGLSPEIEPLFQVKFEDAE